jgi:hypothetical protein
MAIPAFLMKFVSDTLIGGFMKWFNQVTRDNLNQQVGEDRAVKAEQGATIEELKRHAEIDSKNLSVDDAVSGFRVRDSKESNGDSGEK